VASRGGCWLTMPRPWLRLMGLRPRAVTCCRSVRSLLVRLTNGRRPPTRTQTSVCPPNARPGEGRSRRTLWRGWIWTTPRMSGGSGAGRSARRGRPTIRVFRPSWGLARRLRCLMRRSLQFGLNRRLNRHPDPPKGPRALPSPLRRRAGPSRRALLRLLRSLPRRAFLSQRLDGPLSQRPDGPLSQRPDGPLSQRPDHLRALPTQRCEGRRPSPAPPPGPRRSRPPRLACDQAVFLPRCVLGGRAQASSLGRTLMGLPGERPL